MKKRHLIFPALAFLAAISTAAFAGWSLNSSTEVSDLVAAQAYGGGCSYYCSGQYCGVGGSGCCKSTTGYCGSCNTDYGSGNTNNCGSSGCGAVYTVSLCGG